MLSIILVLGVALRVFHLKYLSLWGDELFSRYYYQTGLRYMWTEGLRWESSPPLYYMAVGAWIQVFGSGEAAFRLLSAVSSSVAILLVYILGSELLGRPRALLAAGLFALSATQIYYAQEARPYALLLIPVAVTLLTCARHLREPVSTWNLGCYTVAAILCIYTHATMVFFVFACALAGLLRVGTLRRLRELGIPTGWIGANACVALAALPELNGMLGHYGDDQLEWISPVGFYNIGAVLSNTVVGTLTPADFPGGELAVVLCCLLALALWRHPPDWRSSVIILVIPGLYIACVLVISFFFQPMMLSRIFVWTGIPICLLLAHALSVRWRPQPVVVAVIGIVVSIGLFYQLNTNPDAKEPWRSVISDVRQDLTHADLVVLGPDTGPMGLRYYAPQVRRVKIWTEATRPGDRIGNMLFGTPQITRNEIIQQINGKARVVIVLRTDEERILPSLLQDVRAADQRIDHRCRRGDGQITKYPCGLIVISWHDSGPLLHTISSGTPAFLIEVRRDGLTDQNSPGHLSPQYRNACAGTSPADRCFEH
jgi:mannosyltransferase